ncbi:MAG TPA: fumarylacetoacetate hydrolase family protein [Candidatus Hydrogenedentes bacterium]|nr:fumarylacetoacetate hydrolase family protein [Candidatus Hydrogenedentota bacterium]HOS04269.1 fumarylacetoacetate hydrolase family protein [Candidatus Hydrogenedentota bacterium]
MRIAHIEDPSGIRTWAIQQPDGRLARAEGSPLDGPLRPAGAFVEPARWRPVVEPRALLCIGRNYAGHAKERNEDVPTEPVLFLKNPAAATGHLEAIRIPAVCEDEVDYEGELAVVIGRVCRNVSREDALAHVLGYTIANDVSARVWQSQRGGSQWCRAKSFDTFAPLGPTLVTPDELPDPGAIHIRTSLNGTVLQDCPTREMIFDVPTLIAFLSQDTTLLPGTVILTGTPEGVGWSRTPRKTLRPGDVVAVEIEGIGRLENPVLPPTP